MSARIALVAGLLALASAGCGRGVQEVEEIAHHVEQLVEILEQHPDAPTAAIEAIERYEAEHAGDLQRLRSRAKELRLELGTKAKRALMVVWLERSTPLNSRVKRLSEPPSK